MKKEDLLTAALAFGAVVGLGMWWKSSKSSSSSSSSSSAKQPPSTSASLVGVNPGYTGFDALPADWSAYNTDALSGYMPSWAKDNPYG